eukprot:scaffold5112_cov92-Cylindrotheca_fusiformis.AAC.1
MLHYLQGRIRSDPVVGRMGVPVQFEFCTNEFVAQAFTLSGWASITHEPSSTLYSGGSVSASQPPFHPLFFQRALGPALPLTKVPATGYSSRPAAVVLGSVILFFFQFLDVKVDPTGHIPDTTSFDQSCFGSILSRWAAVPASPVVDAVWSAHPLRCSAWWIAHLLELFKIFSDHHSQRVMLLGETNPAVGIEEVMITPPGETVVVGTNFVPMRESAFKSHTTIQSALANLEMRMRQLWEEQVALGPQAPLWSASFPSHLSDTTEEQSSSAPASGSGRSSQARGGSGDAGDSNKKRPRPAATPFVPQKPLMAFAASASSAPRESPFSILRNRNERDWPRLKDPQGKQHEPCQLCFACCFPPPYNRCGDPERCHVLRKPVYARTRRSRLDAPRLHIDLADEKWSSARYPEQNWKPLVEFIQRNLDVLAPSPELITLTPSTLNPSQRLSDDPSYPFFLRDQVSLPHFVRAPPPHVPPWPGSGDFQWQRSASPSFEDIWVFIAASGFLSPELRSWLFSWRPVLRIWYRCGPFRISRPWQPFRKRLWGFGRMSAQRSCAHDKPNFRMAPHFAWPFLTSFERVTLLRAHPFWFLYAALRKRAVLRSLAPLRLPRSKDHPNPAVSEGLSMSRAVLHSAALLRFDFDYGDFVRWMGGEYTNQSRDWNSEWKHILNLPCRQLPAGYPPPDYVAAFRIIQTEGAPLKGQCSIRAHTKRLYVVH